MTRLHVSVLLRALTATACAMRVIGGGAVVAQPADTTMPRIYFDRAHGEGPVPAPMATLGTRLGFAIAERTGPIDAGALQSHQLVYLRAPNTEITEPERAAIVAFVRSGGSLLVVVDEEQRQPLAVTRVNDLLAAFALSLTADTPYMHNTGAVAKPGDVTRGAYEVPYSGGRAVEGGTAFAWQLDGDGSPAQPFATYTSVAGGGRVVVMAEGMASLFLGSPEGKRLSGAPRDARNTVYWGKDSEPFMADILTWLLRK